MLQTVLRPLTALVGVFLAMGLLVEGLAYLTWSLSPRDPAALQRAGAFESQMSRMVRSPELAQGVPVAGLSERSSHAVARSTSASPGTRPTGVHHLEEWPPARPREFQEAPMLHERVSAGKLPPVTERLPADPLVIVPPQQMGPYGGTWARFADGPQDIGIVEARLAYEGLVRWDARGRSIIPNLARRWAITDGGRTYTFWLRRGVRWSDGEPFSVDDLLFWYEDILQNPDLTPVVPRDYKRSGETMRVEKVDDHTVRFRFKSPNGLFLKALASGRGYEIAGYPAHYLKRFHPRYVPLDTLKALARKSGFDLWNQLFEDRREWRNVEMPRLWPWVVAVPPPARPVVFQRNPFYWKVDPKGNQLPYINRMTFDIFDAETINLKAINGEMGVQERHLQLDNYPLFMENRERGGYQVRHWNSSNGGELVLAPNLNHRDPVMREIIRDRRFRIALSLAIDRQAINEVSYFGIGQPRQIAPPPSSAYYSAAYEHAYIAYDPAEANRLLDAMGLTKKTRAGGRLRPDGRPLQLYIETTSVKNRVLELVASYWSAVGVATEVKEEARQLFYQRKRALMHDVGVWGGADEQVPVLDPRWFIPYSDESIQGIDFARWYRTDGAKGEMPPPPIRRCIELFRRIEETPDEGQQIRLFREIIELNRENLWVIGLVGGLPSIVLVKDTFRNVPEVAISGWSFRTPGSTAVECYAIQEN